MYRIALLNLPFASARLPSIALAQLRSVLKQDLGEKVEVDVHHLNLDARQFLGPQVYDMISGTVQANTSGLGDWFFNQVAFPEMPDNTAAYLARHFSGYKAQLEMFRGYVGAKRAGAGAFIDSLIDTYKLDSYDLVGMTSMFSQNIACFSMARRLKERNPKIKTVMGGANCETPMGNVMIRNLPQIDFVFSGPALKSFPQFVRHQIAGEDDKCHAIPGVLSARKLRLQPVGGVKEIGEELDIDVPVALEYADYFEALVQHGMADLDGISIPFETSRGCWWGERSHCTFCGLNGMTMKYRSMSPPRALELLNGLFDSYKDRSDEFQSVDNILPREYLTEVLPQLEPPEGISLFYEVKADLKDREMAVMAKAGVTRIQPGIESLNTDTLKRMRKGTTSFQNINFLKNCSIYGIKPSWNLLLGFPGEPEEIYRKYYDDLPLLTHLHPPTGAYPVRFDRFSPYHKQAAEYGLKLRSCEFYGMLYPFSNEDLQEMAYFFVDDDFAASYQVNTANWIGRLRQRIDHWTQRWHQRDGLLQPELRFQAKGDGEVVYDSRSGRVVEHALDAEDLKLLRALSKAHKVSRIVGPMDGMSEAEIEQRISALKERGLIFQERDLYMSVVVEPPTDEGAAFLPYSQSRDQIDLHAQAG